MSVGYGSCPNCGSDLRGHRAERQHVGQREVVLQWSICPICHHVRLEHWDWIDDHPDEENEERSVK